MIAPTIRIGHDALPQASVKPHRCVACGREPWICESCGDYQCGCPVPFLAQRTKNQRIMPRAHYDKNGKPYTAKNLGLDSHETYPDDDEDTKWLLEAGFKP